MNRNRIARMAAAVSILLILGTGLISSGICVELTELVGETNFEGPVGEKLTRKDIGILLLSLPLSKDREQRLFLQQTIKQLILKGEITQKQVQDIANKTFGKSPMIFLFAELDDHDYGIILPIPGIIKSYKLRDPYLSLFLFQISDVYINDIYYNTSAYSIIGFYGEAYNYFPPREYWRIYRYRISGVAMILMAF